MSRRIRPEVLRAIAAYREPEVTAYSREDVDPYRCPECDKALERLREGGSLTGMACHDHGQVEPRYDQYRAGRGASLSFAPSDCGCYGDSGPYTVHCQQHDPEALLALLIEEIERLQSPG